jgi:iron(III) transport system substrate-binding protein
MTVAAGAALWVMPAAAQKTEILVYTAIETDQIKAYQEGFNKAYPDIELKWVRDSTGVITAKLIAEKANPHRCGDGPCGDQPRGPDSTACCSRMRRPTWRRHPQYRDSRNPPMWFGMDVWGATICFNTVEAAKQNLPKPATWKDLTKPVYKGKIVMPHPASSGSGFLDVTAWMQMWGEADAWKYMDALHENIAQYTHSGSKPCRQAGAGEFPIGIAFEYRASTTKASGAPIDLIFPTEGGLGPQAVGIMKGTKKLEAARKFADWSSSKEAAALYAKNYAIVAIPGIAQPLPNIPADYEKRLVKNDFAWAAKNRDRIIEAWNKRYNAKAEPK